MRDKRKTKEVNQELKLLKKLFNDNQIIAKQVDKGGNIVLMMQENYVRMCKKILDNHEWYRK